MQLINLITDYQTREIVTLSTEFIVKRQVMDVLWEPSILQPQYM